MQKVIKKYISDSIAVKKSVLGDEELIKTMENVANLILQAYKNGKKVLLSGNGGSAADAQHLTAELVNQFYIKRKALAAIALTVDSSVLTSIANDSGYENIFSRQVEANASKGDVLIVLSTSGKSKNIIKAVKQAKKQEVFTVSFSGSGKSVLDELCDYSIKVPSTQTPIVQESHIMIGHIICALIEGNL